MSVVHETKRIIERAKNYSFHLKCLILCCREEKLSLNGFYFLRTLQRIFICNTDAYKIIHILIQVIDCLLKFNNN